MASTLRGGIVINEILIDPANGPGFDTDGSGTANGRDEFIELYNTSGSAIDVGGLEFWDRGRDNWYTVPDGTTLQAGASLTIVRSVTGSGSLPTTTGDDIALNAGFGSNVFNNTQDNIVLYDPDADEYVQALYNGDAEDDPIGGPGYDGFSATATRSGPVEDFGNDNDGFSIQRWPAGSDTFVNDETPTPGDAVCFTTGVQILTVHGVRPVESLNTGDILVTLDHGLQPVRRIISSEITAVRLMVEAHRRPIVIQRGALGRGQPARDLRVSPQHRILIRNEKAGIILGANEHLVPAVHLLGWPGVSRDDSCEPFSYFHLIMDRHEVIFADGAPAESLYFGHMAQEVIGPNAIEELLAIFPDLEAEFAAPTAARPFLQREYVSLLRDDRETA